MKKSLKNIKIKVKKSISFSKLPAWKQRVAIAKDVILKIKSNRYKSEQGTYLNICSTDKGNEKSNIWQMQANTAVKNELAVCNVCAKGALFMSHIMKTNHCSLLDADSASESEYVDRLTMFTQGQLDTIECAFERGIVFDREGILKDRFGDTTELGERAKIFCPLFDSANERLIKIMKNIIKNKGKFLP